jgi:DNA polymerase III delta prime subunit
MGKDRVLELEQLASAVPFYDEHKVIIIDEAQELSKQSFGATLRLLEKKRPEHSHTHFILCTMDRNAIAKPIKDRCQTYKFWPVAADTIAEHLYTTLKALDTVDVDSVPEEFITQGLFMIADYAAGSVRAALAALERVVYADLWTPEEIQEELGYISADTLAELIMKLLQGDPAFFSHLKRSPDALSDFYYKSWAALLDAKLYVSGAFSEGALPEWKRKSATRFMANPASVDKVLEIYTDIFENSRYMKPDYFLSKLWSALFEIPTMHKPSQPASNTVLPTPSTKKVRRRKGDR